MEIRTQKKEEESINGDNECPKTFSEIIHVHAGAEKIQEIKKKIATKK